MPWVLTVTGDCDEDAERDLAEKLGRLLATPKYGVNASQLSGLVLNGPAHLPPKASK